MASIENFSALDIRIGKITEVEEPEVLRKLYKVSVDLGELGSRNVLAGIKAHYSRDQLIGKYVVVLSNIEPKTIAGMTSEAMLLAADDGDNVSLLIPDKQLRPGSRIR